MISGTLVRNISCVNMAGARLWALVVVIGDAMDPKGSGPLAARQIRGFGQNGRDIFTVWIDPQCEVKIEQTDGGNMVLLDSKLAGGANVNLDRGAVIRAIDQDGQPVALFVMCEDPTKPISVERFEVERYDDAFFDDAILKTWGAPGYTVTLSVPKRDLPSIRSQLREWGSPL